MATLARGCMVGTMSVGIRTGQKQAARLVVRGHALQQRQGVADTVRGGRGELRGVEQRVDRDDLLQERCHDAYVSPQPSASAKHRHSPATRQNPSSRDMLPTKRVPQDQGQLRHLFALLAELEQGRLSGAAVHELGDPAQDAAILVADAVLQRGRRRSLAAVAVQVVRQDVVVGRDAVIVMLLRERGRGRCGLGLSVGLRFCYDMSVMKCLLRGGRKSAGWDGSEMRREVRNGEKYSKELFNISCFLEVSVWSGSV